MFLGQNPNATLMTGRDSISDFSTDSNSNSLHRDEEDERKRKQESSPHGKKKEAKENGKNIRQRVRDAQVLNYLCHLFEGAGHGEERLD